MTALQPKTILVVGATGLVGGEVVRLLRLQGADVTALVRESSDASKLSALREQGARIAIGDLKRPDTIEKHLRGVNTLISTVSSTLSRQDGDSIQSVDLEGQLALIESALRSQVEHFIFVSFAPLAVDCKLQQAKRAVEARLRSSGMAYTILQPVDFCEVWLGPALGFDPANGRAVVWGSGRARSNWISFRDVAGYAASSVFEANARNQVLPLGGPEATSQLEVLGLFARFGLSAQVEHVSLETLQAAYESASDDLSQAFAALQITTAHGYVVDASLTHRILPRELATVRSYVRTFVEARKQEI